MRVVRARRDGSLVVEMTAHEAKEVRDDLGSIWASRVSRSGDQLHSLLEAATTSEDDVELEEAERLHAELSEMGFHLREAADQLATTRAEVKRAVEKSRRTAREVRAKTLADAAEFVRDAYFVEGLTVQEIGTALHHWSDRENYWSDREAPDRREEEAT